jgi:hypothetical protein
MDVGCEVVATAAAHACATLGPMRSFRNLAKRILPEDMIERYRRRRTLRRYLRTLSYELHDRQTMLDVEQLEGTVLARRPDLTERMMKDILERTDLVLQQLDRQIEGLRARHGNELASLRQEMDALRASLAELEKQIGPGARVPD